MEHMENTRSKHGIRWTTESAKAAISQKFPEIQLEKFEFGKSSKASFIITCAEHGDVQTCDIAKYLRRSIGCPKCSYGQRKTRLRSNEEAIRTLSEVHPDIDFSNIVYKSDTEDVEFVCPEHGLQKRSFIGVKIGKNACRECSNEDIGNTRRSSLEEFVDQARVLYGDLDDFSKTVYLNRRELVIITCKAHGDYSILPCNYLAAGRCFRCNEGQTSKAEKEIAQFIKDLGVDIIERYKLPGKGRHRFELDIFVPSLNIGIEFDGIYYHGELMQDTKCLLKKRELCESFGIQSIHIFEDEWKYKKEIVKNRLKSILGFSERIFARNCEVRELGGRETSKFLEQNHIQGNANSSINLGLEFKGVLRAVMTFGKTRFFHSEDNVYELIRYCSIGSVIGGFSKLLKRFYIIQKDVKEIISYSDRRWSDGNVYEKNGFSFTHRTNPGYFWCKADKRHSRLVFQKRKLSNLFPKTNCDGKTEIEICHENGYWRIWDCGNDVWSFKLK